MKKRKELIGIVLAVLVCAGASETFSYMNDKGEVFNRLSFTGENGISAVLTEPAWNPDNGILTIPDKVIAKDPQVTNTSTSDIDEMVALKCEFLYGKECPDKEKAGTLLSYEDMEKVVQVYQIDYNSDDPVKKDWIRFNGQKRMDPVQCFYYTKILKRNLPAAEGERTIPLFTGLTIDKRVNEKQQSLIRKMVGFEIRISGQVLQQMENEEYFGLDNPKSAYEAGLFNFADIEQKGKK